MDSGAAGRIFHVFQLGSFGVAFLLLGGNVFVILLFFVGPLGLVAETEAEVERLKGQPGIRPMQDIRVAGTPAQVTDALRAIIQRGEMQDGLSLTAVLYALTFAQI